MALPGAQTKALVVEGIIAVDALIGLTLIAMALSLVLVGQRVAADAERRSFSLKAARELGQFVVLTGPQEPGDYEGRSGATTWRLRVVRTGNDPICLRRVELTARDRTKPELFSSAGLCRAKAKA